MNKAVLISIRPKWCELIASGKKTIEIRKTAPKIEPPFKCYIYETRGFERVGNDNLNCIIGGGGRGMVIGEFVCDKTEVYDYEYCTHPEIGMDYDCGDNWFCVDDADLKNACLSYEELRAYAVNKDAYGWHISDLVIYDDPKKLSEFTGLRKTKFGYAPYEITRPPQSWCYVEEE